MSKHDYDLRHGGPWDRGSADAYYNRPFVPHYFKGNSYVTDRVLIYDFETEEYYAYKAGWDYQTKISNDRTSEPWSIFKYRS